MNQLTIQKRSALMGTVQHLPSSKSVSNRALILNALTGNKGNLLNLSDANDTKLMQRLVFSSDDLIDVEDAGTVMRFLTAYFAITRQQKTLTGAARMKERPIGVLVEALRTLGVSISYLEKEGYPPIRIGGFPAQQVQVLSVRGDISSQYISALMMVAPSLPQGLIIHLTGHVASKPYIEMTASLMRKFGAIVTFEENTITIPNQSLSVSEFTVEGDWSSASYWFAFASLAKEAELLLPGLVLRSLQGDRVIVEIMEKLGVACEPRGAMLLLRRKEHQEELVQDFDACPDLAQTVAVVCAAKGVKATFTGLESLRIKETDRIAALQNELAKIGATLTEDSSRWILTPSASLPSHVQIRTYHDHRMAMAFAPLSTLMNVTIEEPTVTRKSYPRFWDDLKGLGYQCN
jgi:3-phosphoshikimate 1-carboxyvinyltransferase